MPEEEISELEIDQYKVTYLNNREKTENVHRTQEGMCGTITKALTFVSSVPKGAEKGGAEYVFFKNKQKLIQCIKKS